MSRRGLLARAGGVVLGGGALAALAGCENTTTPVGAGGGGGGKGILGDPTAGGPVDSAGIPLARRDYPVTLPKFGDPVKTSAKPEKGGELKIYNYADYLNPAVIKAFGKREGVSVRVTTFDTLDEAFSKLSNGQLEFDVIFSTPDQLSKLVGARLLQPVNMDLVPNLQKNVWPELHSPFYDVGPRYSVPYVTYTTGVAWRNDKLDFDPSKLDQPWDAFWQAKKYAGKVAILDDYREGPGLALMRRGHTDLNTEDPALLDQAVSDLQQLSKDVRVKVSIADYETVPAGRVWLHHAWSGDMIAGVISYLPKGTKPDVLSYWYQKQGGPLFNDIITVAAKAAEAGHRPPVPQLHARQRRGLRELLGLRRLPAAADLDLAPEALRRGDHSPVAVRGRRHARGLRERQRLHDTLGDRRAALEPGVGQVPERVAG